MVYFFPLQDGFLDPPVKPEDDVLCEPEDDDVAISPDTSALSQG